MKNKIYGILVTSITLVCLSPAVTAETFSYTSLTAGFVIFSEEVNGTTEDFEGEGVGAELSLNVLPNIALTASYSTGSADVTSSGTTISADVDVASIGVLFHTPINNTTDFVAGVDIIKGSVDLDVNGSFFSSEDADGNSIYIGIRAMAAPQLELNGSINRTKIEDDTNTDIEFGASYYIDNLVSLNISYDFTSDGNSTSFSVTKYF